MKNIIAAGVIFLALCGSASAQPSQGIFGPGDIPCAYANCVVTTINKVTITTPATAATLTIANNKTFTVNNTITLAGTDAQTYTFPATSATIARTDTGQTFTGTNIFGVTNATSLALGGATIGPDALGVTGTETHTTAALTTAVSGQTFNTTWNNAGVTFPGALIVNVTSTNSANFSTLFDVTVGGTSAFRVDKGSNAYAVTSVNVSSSAGFFGLRNQSTIISSPANNSLQIGPADVDTAPVAQTIRTQGALAGGTSNVAGANWTFIASPGKGTGAGGSFIFQTTPAGSTGTALNAPVTALTIDSTKLATFAGQINVTAMTQTSAAQSGTVCYNSGTGAVTYDATLGCLTSLEERKNIKPGGMPEALPEIMALKPFWFSWKDKPLHHDNDYQPGLGAHATEKVDERLVGYGPDGNLRGVRYPEMVALLVAGMQQQQREIDELKRRAGVPANDNFWTRLKWVVGQ